jgi:hypothetical protein
MRPARVAALLGLFTFLPSVGEATKPARDIIYIQYVHVVNGHTKLTYYWQPIEDYIMDVLPNEWITAWDAETLKAGAVIVRSGAWWHVNRSALGSRWPSNNCDGGSLGGYNFDVCDPNVLVCPSGKQGFEQWYPDKWQGQAPTNLAVFQTQYYHAETSAPDKRGAGAPDRFVALRYDKTHIQKPVHNASGDFIAKLNSAYTGNGAPYNPNQTCSQTDPWSVISFPSDAALDPGTIVVQATLDGVPWVGPLSYTLSGPQFIQGDSTGAFPNVLGGSYTFSYGGGGPAGGSLVDIFPGPTQTLVDQGTITFQVNFRSSPQMGFLIARVNLDGVEWNGGITYQVSGPKGSFSGASVFEEFLVSPGVYNVQYIVGGPPNTKYVGLDVAPSQSVGVGETITFTFYFTAFNLEPVVDNERAIGIAATGATLMASVNAEGLQTDVYFQYGVDGAGAFSSTAHSPISAITFPIDVAEEATGLTCGTTYTFYAVATNNAGMTVGPAQTFTTSPCGPGAGTSFYTLTPCRILDTRPPVNNPIGADNGRWMQIAGTCGIPLTAKAVALNVTVVLPTSQGFLSLYPSPPGYPAPNYTVAFGAGTVRAASTVVGLNADGTLDVFCAMPSGQGQTDYILDVSGYFQ